MSRRWLTAGGCCLLLLVLVGCELATPVPFETAAPRAVSPTAALQVLPTETPIPWPAERLVFAHLEKVWLAEGGPPYALTLGRAPALSPDGRRVAYLLDVEAGLSQVYILDLERKELTLVSGPPAPYSPPAWSPDGLAVAYTNGAFLIVADIRGETQRVLATDVGAQGQGQIVPAWSSDGQTLVCPLTRLGPPELFALRLADGEAVRLSYTGGYPVEAPFVVTTKDTAVALHDVALYTNPADGGTIWAAGLDGSGRQRVLLDMTGGAGMLRLSPDGRRLAGLRQEETGYALWTVDLTTEMRYPAGTLNVLPDLLTWGRDDRTLYWIEQGRLYRYVLASGRGQEMAVLPPPSPTPTPTPLPIVEQLVVYQGRFFYQVEPYRSLAEADTYQLAQSRAVSTGYTLDGDTVAFPLGADVYQLELRPGEIAERLYSFQQVGLEGLELAWSVQGNALLYAATYEQEEETTFGRRIDLGVIEPATSQVRRFVLLADRMGATPLLYDEERGEAVILPRGEGALFFHLEVYDVASGQLQRILPVEGERSAAVSPDWQWGISTGYDPQAGRGFLRTFTLTTPEVLTQTFFLPEGTFTWGPLRWSSDGRYVAFILLQGDPYAEGGWTSQGVWVLQPATLEARQVLFLEDPDAYLVGWR